MTYKEFYIWLDGYLSPKLENKKIEISPIVEKMSQVVSDETKLTQDFEKYKKLKESMRLRQENSPQG